MRSWHLRFWDKWTKWIVELQFYLSRLFSSGIFHGSNLSWKTALGVSKRDWDLSDLQEVKTGTDFLCTWGLERVCERPQRTNWRSVEKSNIHKMEVEMDGIKPWTSTGWIREGPGDHGGQQVELDSALYLCSKKGQAHPRLN